MLKNKDCDFPATDEVTNNTIHISVHSNYCTSRNSYITGARDVWHLLHRSTRAHCARGLRAINAMHPECM